LTVAFLVIFKFFAIFPGFMGLFDVEIRQKYPLCLCKCTVT